MAVKIIENIDEWTEIFNSEIKGQKSLGFVPTMGALHIGHSSLITRSVKENDVTICSIFVNPTQFNDVNDLNSYPITIREDVELLEKEGCDYLFLPNKSMIYPDDYNYKLSEQYYSKLYCGAHREGHFDGVLTVVLKLLNITQCDNAYFGEKDWQQYKLIAGMARALFLHTNIVPCKLIREVDGLAFSSRNKNLKPEHRKIAPEFHKILSSKKSIEEMKKQLTSLGFRVDYIEIEDPGLEAQEDSRILAAAYLGEVRLIDNVKR